MDRVADILLAAMKQALTGPAQQRLYKSGKLEGLFPGSGGAAGEAAARALREGLLEIARTETRGKTVIEWVRPTPAGVDFVAAQESPARALDELRAALRLGQRGIPGWLAEVRTSLGALEERLAADARQWQERLDALARRVEETLRRIEQAVPPLPADVLQAHPWSADALNYLDRRRGSGAAGDCPLPELFAALRRQHAELSVGAFHEGLKRLQERHALRLLPVTGNGALPQPEYALFDGDAVFYYAAR
jgi:hypothetical protein